MKNKLPIEMSEFQSRGSGWSFYFMKCLECNINKFNPLSGSSYIKLPGKI